MSERYGYENYDRKQELIKGNSVEVMDLYKEKCMYVVKIGNTSSKLCYAVDQSITGLKLYKEGKVFVNNTIDTVVLWIILERKEHIEDKFGKPDVTNLNTLMLKIRIDQWMKEVRKMGYKPMLKINYREI